jgi:dynein heavy chain
MQIFMDDLSTPEKNEWGDQSTSEILRQLIDDQGFYNLDKPGLPFILFFFTLLF